MAKNYRDVNYFENRPDIVKIFDDLEKFHDFCRFELLPFNEADLYNRNSTVWTQYTYATRPKKPWKDRNNDYNRSGNNRRFHKQ